MECANSATTPPTRHADRFESLFQRVLQFSLHKTPEEMLTEYLRICRELSGASSGSILAEEGPDLRFLFSEVPSLIGMRVPWESIAGSTARRSHVIYTYAPSDKRHFKGVDDMVAKQTRYLLSIPICSIHMTSAASQHLKSSGVLQLLFDDNILPELDVSTQASEISIEDFKEHACYEQKLKEVFWILPNIAFGMEVMRLRQTSYQVIHELKNKLIGSQSWMVCLKEDLESKTPDLFQDETLKEDYDLAESTVREGAELAKGYLQFSKLYTPKFRESHINPTLTETAANVRVFADNLGGPGTVGVETRLDETITAREMDPEQLKMAFFNLGKNAVEALIEHKVVGARITISSLRTPEGFIVTVEDNGPGMPEQIASNLFLPFQTKKAGGTGLGLTITKKILDIHGCLIRCETSGNGTRFLVDF